MYLMYIQYIVYNVYIKYKEDNMYKVSEARKSLRLLLNECDKGNEVIIERYGEQYVLLARMGADSVKKHFDSATQAESQGTSAQSKKYDLSKSKESELPRPKTINAPKEVVDIARGLNLKKDRNGLCKIHGIPLDGRGRCLQKGCKYS